jgi:hypothetical protein
VVTQAMGRDKAALSRYLSLPILSVMMNSSACIPVMQVLDDDTALMPMAQSYRLLRHTIICRRADVLILDRTYYVVVVVFSVKCVSPF